MLTVLLHASYKQAQSYYDNKEYAKALQEAKASTDEYSNPKLHLVWAKSAEALGMSNEAMSAYECVALLDKEDTEAKVALLKIYTKTDRDNLANDLSDDLHNYSLSPEQRNSLKLLRNQNSDSGSVKADARLSIGYDSNINVSADANTLNDYDPFTSHTGEVSTLFTRVNGSISYVKKLENSGGWYSRGDVKFYYQNNSDASFYNMFVGSLRAGVGYVGSNYTLYLPLEYTYIHYLEVSLLTQISIHPKANISLSKDLILNLNAKYSSRDYSESKYRGMNDSSYGGGVGFYYLFSKNYLYTTLLYEHFNSSEDVHLLYIDKSMLTFTTGVNYEISPWLVGKLDYRYRRGEYKDRSRDDNYNQVTLKLSHFFTKNYELFISGRYGKNSSNYIPAKYTKNIAMFGLRANY